ncbi:iron complex outermembrane receptor protein [Christiangramia gaetbulicola]|uniref:Iron complex outermembrane receptor protein n=1 Tax=Christiangramia gaetbulicola TaxID=703340 RepID=A0A2T6AHI9_9FLAO|nr:TonB-dependent receptor [Christiangramia gaetbulicola]PTX43293.1 iron complex outermembrane receptor protein [Christiangramia gaetbulicola]
MNRNLYLLFTLFLCCCLHATAQNDFINWLDEVLLSDVKLNNNSEGQFVKEISASVIQRSEPLLTSLLKFNTPFFFRENGYGMVSSASVRGTGASQTAVIWNGININSQFTGQTDFNTVNTKVFDNISLRPGGGSVVYGSGAIGGTIHLSNEFRFDGNSENELRLGYGSFDSYQASYNGNFSTEKTSVNIGLAGVSSENDYKYLDTQERNENGDFYNVSLNASIAHWIGDSNILKFYSNYYQGDRGFSGTLNLPSNSEFEDRNSRNLLEWKSFAGKFTSSLKLAWLDESFKYYENRDSDNFSSGDAETGIIKYDLEYEFSKNKRLNLIVDYTDVQGEGTGIENAERKIGGISALWSHQLERLSYELSLRQEITNNYDSPLLFSIGSSYQFSENYLLRFNSSHNFRIPTFNDLFWLQGGNTDLDPETSLQAEIGNELKFNDFKINLTGYFIDIDDLIRWIPDGSGIWRPVNTANVHNYGLEFFAGWNTQLGNNPFSLNSSYAYTRSIDQETDDQLIYTPQHKVTLSAGYEIENFSVLLQSLYNGSIYTSSDNNYELEAYEIADLYVGYTFLTKPEIGVDLRLNNIFNKKYQSLPSRIMPGRSINSTLTFKF